MRELEIELRERAASYRLGGPSSEHTALILEAAAAKIEYLKAVIEVDRELIDDLREAQSNNTQEEC